MSKVVMSFLKRKRVREIERWEGLSLKMLVLRMMKAATNQERWVLSRNWKREGNGFVLKSLERNSVLLTP